MIYCSRSTCCSPFHECICVCMYVCVNVCMRVFMCVCVSVRASVYAGGACVRVCVNICMCIYQRESEREIEILFTHADMIRLISNPNLSKK